eukprot:NODE_684_length_5217_cov_0.512505.p3 type:complete len:350 gc:universal NODE_684_length_5217_cov_0.512505:5055-4006(-)
MELETSLCMLKIAGIQFDDGIKSTNSELNIFQCLYRDDNSQNKTWITFLSVAVENGFFTLPLTKEIESRMADNKVLLRDGESYYTISLPQYEESLFDVLRMYTALPDPKQANNLVVMDNFGTWQSFIRKIPSDTDFTFEENVEIKEQNENDCSVSATKEDAKAPEHDIQNIGQRVGSNIFGVGNSLAGKINSYAIDYKKTHNKGEEVVFSENTKKYVKNMQKASQKAYKVANYTVVRKLTKIGNKAGTAVGKRLGYYAPEQLKSIAMDTMDSLVTVWNGFENGARLVVDSSGNAMIEIVEYKYGGEARDIAESFCQTGKYIVLMYFDYKGIGRSAILKTIGKAAITSKK